MQILEQFYYKNLQKNFVNKHNCALLKHLIKLKKINLIFKNNLSNLKLIATCFIVFEFLTKKKSKFILVKNKNLTLKTKFGKLSGCKIILLKKQLFIFLKKLILSSFLFKKFITIKKNNNFIVIKLLNLITFFNFTKFYNIFCNIKKLNIVILTNLIKKQNKNS